MTPPNPSVSRGKIHPAQLPKTERSFDSRGLPWAFEANFPIAQIRDAEGHQVRFVKNRTPRHTVDRYTEQMRAGATFPAIVVNDAGEVVDGNTRLAAARRLGRDTIATYVVSNLGQTVARLLSVELNQCHGEAMSPKEVHAVVINTIRDGQNPNVASMARMSGIKPAKIRRWVKDEAARRRAIDAGLSMDRFDQLKEPIRVALGGANLKSVFVAAFELATDADLPAGDVQAIIRFANEATSEADALAVIGRAREEHAAEITAKASGLRRAARRGADAARHLAALQNFDASDLGDVAPEKASEAIARMEGLQAKLEHALSLLRSDTAAAGALAVAGTA